MQDNAAVLDLIEGRMGIVTFLNEECILPKGGDGPFTSKVKPRPTALVCERVSQSFCVMTPETDE